MLIFIAVPSALIIGLLAGLYTAPYNRWCGDCGRARCCPECSKGVTHATTGAARPAK